MQETGPADDRTRPRTVWAVTLPILFVELSDSLLHIIDTVLLGRVGGAELAALGLVDSLFEFVAIPIFGVAGALQILVARRHGQGRAEAVRSTRRQGMRLLVAVSAVLTAVLILAVDPVSRLLIGDPAVAAAARDFLLPTALSLPPLAVGLGYASFHLGLLRTKVLIGATALLLGLNASVGYALVLGHWGAPAMGIAGAGWALLIAETGTAVLLFTVARLRDPLGPAPPRGHGEGRSAMPETSGLLRLTPGIALQAGVETGRWLLFFMVVARLGQHATAVATVVYAWFAILMVPTYAFDETTVTWTSAAVGRQELPGLARIRRRLTLLALAVTAPLGAVGLLAPRLVLRVLAEEVPAASELVWSLRAVSVVMVLVIPAEIWRAALAGTGDVDGSFHAELVGGVLFVGVGAVALLSLGLGQPAAWLALGAAELVALAVCARRLGRERWRSLSL